MIDDSTTPPTVTNIGYERHTVVPGQDYSKEDPKVQAICQTVFTPTVISAYQAMVAAQQVKLAWST